MKVGFIGLGTMGGRMAANIQKGGFEMVVSDVNEAAASPLLAAGATWADTPRQIAEASDIVFTSLPGPAEVELVALGKDGLLEGMSAGKVFFDLSTSSPTLIRKIEAIFAQKGVH